MTIEITVALVSLFGLLVLGIPIAVALAVSGGIGLWLLQFPLLVVAQRLTAGTQSFVLLAIPFFILAGAIMEAGGLSRRLIKFSDAAVGFLPGGLANANIGASMIFGGISGSAVADTSAVGSVMIPAMERAGYSRNYSAAVTAAASPIGMIIPPSIPMIVWSYISGQSLNELFLAGLIPGCMIALVLVVISVTISRKRGFQPGFRPFSAKALLATLVDGILALGTPAIIIGGIMFGIFTPTEASVMAFAYAIAITALVYREISWRGFLKVLLSAGKTSASIMFIVCGATVFSFFLTVSGIPDLIGQLLVGSAATPLGFVIAASALLFVLGMFLDTTTTILMVGPIIAPLMMKVGVDPLVATMVFMVILAVGLVTPPVGLCLFVVSSIVPVRVVDVARECIPFIVGMIFVALLVWLFPQTVTWVKS